MICFAVASMPAYMACAVEEFIREHSNEDVALIATYSDVPKTSADVLAGIPIKWVSNNESKTLIELIGKIPDVIVVSGWFIPSLNRYAAEVRRRGGIVIANVDNIMNGYCGIKKWQYFVYFNLFIRRKFYGYQVPGKLSFDFLRFLGVPAKRITTGLYTADPKIFSNGSELANRPKRFIYVGRFCERKNVVAMVRAFSSILEKYPDWSFELYGEGDLQAELETFATRYWQIVIHPFAQPVQLAEAYRNARFFVLGSSDEHWGVVVHEAALSGCCLLLSDKIGAAADLATSENSIMFVPNDMEEIKTAFMRAVSMSDDELLLAQKASLEKASLISPTDFSARLNSLLETVGGK